MTIPRRWCLRCGAVPTRQGALVSMHDVASMCRACSLTHDGQRLDMQPDPFDHERTQREWRGRENEANAHEPRRTGEVWVEAAQLGYLDQVLFRGLPSSVDDTEDIAYLCSLGSMRLISRPTMTAEFVEVPEAALVVDGSVPPILHNHYDPVTGEPPPHVYITTQRLGVFMARRVFDDDVDVDEDYLPGAIVARRPIPIRRNSGR